MTTIYCDGFLIESNPSPIGGGYTITDDEGNLIERKTIYQGGLTNNAAKLRGIVRAVQLAAAGSTVVTDSKIAMRWVRRGRCGARSDLNGEAKKCKRLIRWKKIRVRFVPRDENLAGVYNEENRVEDEHQPP